MTTHSKSNPSGPLRDGTRSFASCSERTYLTSGLGWYSSYEYKDSGAVTAGGRMVPMFPWWVAPMTWRWLAVPVAILWVDKEAPAAVSSAFPFEADVLAVRGPGLTVASEEGVWGAILKAGR